MAQYKGAIASPADQSTVNVEVDAGGAAYSIAVYA